MRFRSNKHCHLKTLTGQNDALQTLITQWLDNIIIHKYAKFDPNIPYGSRVRRIFTNRPQQAGLMLSKHSSIKNVVLHASGKGMLTSKMLYKVPCGSRVMNIFTIY